MKSHSVEYHIAVMERSNMSRMVETRYAPEFVRGALNRFIVFTLYIWAYARQLKKEIILYAKKTQEFGVSVFASKISIRGMLL